MQQFCSLLICSVKNIVLRKISFLSKNHRLDFTVEESATSTGYQVYRRIFHLSKCLCPSFLNSKKILPPPFAINSTPPTTLASPSFDTFCTVSLLHNDFCTLIRRNQCHNLHNTHAIIHLWSKFCLNLHIWNNTSHQIILKSLIYLIVV